jgi:diguanylate cyclase (GGDEF)-like protein
MLLLGFITDYVSAQDIFTADELIIAVPERYPPYYSLDDAGRPVGFAIDAFEAVASRAGLRFKYDVKDSWKEVIHSLEQGNSDIIPNIGITENRSRIIDFTSPVVTFPISLFVRQSNQQINSLEDLSGYRVAVVSQDTSHNELIKHKKVTLVEFSNIDRAFYALISGQVEAMAFQDPVMWHIAREFQLDDKIRVISPPLLEIKHAMAVNKAAPQLKEVLELSLQAFLISSEYEQAYKKWFSSKQPFWDATSVFWSMTGVLVMLVIVFVVFRHRELLAVNATLQKQIDKATHQLSARNEYLQDLTMTDALTGINNRRAFENSLQSLMAYANRYNDGFSMLIFDIDDFKLLNDRFGHDMGDRVLKDLVSRILEIVRDEDELCRWGGEEFTILMPKTGHEGAMKMAERCRSIVADTLFDEVGPVTISLGVTGFCNNDTERKLFKRADDALYKAKSDGKNCVVWIGEKC